ncbi:hypothetical protein ACGFIV_31090 [Sphaerisporangium sp. NPDC049003]|uniref:hypothetical protein n=1 Tax=Sphaerisporangium sp. NPDC049003 TaxID=3364517 RepID=UPI0037193B47
MTVGVILVVFLGCLVFLPTWLVEHALGERTASALTAADWLGAVNDARSTLLLGLGGLLALGGIALGAVVTLRQVHISREGQFIDLFTKAIKQLAGDKLPVRLGGGYAMEQIAEAAPHYLGHVRRCWPPSSGSRCHGHRPGPGGRMPVRLPIMASSVTMWPVPSRSWPVAPWCYLERHRIGEGGPARCRTDLIRLKHSLKS